MNINLSIFRLSSKSLTSSPLISGVADVKIKSSMFSRFVSPLFYNIPKIKLEKTSFKSSLAPVYVSNEFIDQRRYYTGEMKEKFDDSDSNHELIFDNVLFSGITLSSSESLVTAKTDSFYCSCTNFYDIKTGKTIFNLQSVTHVKYSALREVSVGSIFAISNSNVDNNVLSLEKCTSSYLQISGSSQSVVSCNSVNISDLSASGVSSAFISSTQQKSALVEYCSCVSTDTESLFVIAANNNLALRSINFVSNKGTLFDLSDDINILNSVFIKNNAIAKSKMSPIGYQYTLHMYTCQVDDELADAGAVTGEAEQFGVDPVKVTYEEITYLHSCQTYTPTLDKTPIPTLPYTPFKSLYETPFNTLPFTLFDTPFSTLHFTPGDSPVATPARTVPITQTLLPTTYYPARTPKRSPTPSPPPTRTFMPTRTFWPTITETFKPTPFRTPLRTPLPSTLLPTKTPLPTPWPTSSPEPTFNVLMTLTISIPSVLVAALIPLIIFAALRIVREMSSNDPVEAAQYEPFLSTGSSSDSSRDDLLEINASESDDDLTVTREMFVPRFRDFSKYMPKRNENEKKEDLIYGFLK